MVPRLPSHGLPYRFCPIPVPAEHDRGSAAPPAAPDSTPPLTSYRLTSLPPELQMKILEQLVSAFFREHVKRLAVSKKWKEMAVRVMYRHLDVLTILYPFAPMEKTYNFMGFHEGRDTENYAENSWAARPEYRDIISDTLKHNLRTIRLDMGVGIMGVWVEPMYLHSKHDSEWRKAKEVEADRFMIESARHRPFHGDEIWGSDGIKSLREAIDWQLHSLQLLSFTRTPAESQLSQVSTKLVELDLQVREPWDCYGGTWNTFAAVLCTIIQDVRPSALRLDLAGMAIADVTVDGPHESSLVKPFEFIPGYDRFVNSAISSWHLKDLEEMPKSQMTRRNLRWRMWPMKYHLCNAIRAVLPNLKVLCLRGPTLCGNVFRDMKHGDPEHPLPKLKVIIINLAMPGRPFAHRQVCHCGITNHKLTHSAMHGAANSLWLELIEELERLLPRLDNPEMIRVRFARRLGNSEVDREFIRELDFLTDREVLRAIDEWGVVKSET